MIHMNARHLAEPKPRARNVGEQGVAVIITLIVLSVISLLGFYMALGATTETRISDNFESRMRAEYAARAGLDHARELFRGVEIDDQLNGPVGYAERSPSLVETARRVAFRNPLTWVMARSLNLTAPATDVAGLPTEGLMNTGAYTGIEGTVLIPITGIAFNSQTRITARYFVKVADNSGEASELLGDPSNDPFSDGDHIVLVRSMGLATTLQDDSGGIVRRNAVAMYEARLKRRMTFDLDAPLVVEGDQVQPSASQMFAGNAFGILGDTDHFGIATIDTNTGNGVSPNEQIRGQVAENQKNNIRGKGTTPSIGDITDAVAADPDKSLLLDQNYLWNFVNKTVPAAADNIFLESQSWHGGDAPDLGYIDVSLPANAPSQRPKMTYIKGDLAISGNITGGGVLVVTGRLGGSGSLQFNGLILVIGTGDVDGSGLNIGYNGGMFVSQITMVNGVPTFGTPKISWKGNSNITINSQALRMGMNLFPPAQLSWREITSIIDP